MGKALQKWKNSLDESFFVIFEQLNIKKIVYKGAHDGSVALNPG